MRFYTSYLQDIAQLVERSTVEASADIEWSLVRFRVFGFFFPRPTKINEYSIPGLNWGPSAC